VAFPVLLRRPNIYEHRIIGARHPFGQLIQIYHDRLGNGSAVELGDNHKKSNKYNILYFSHGIFTPHINIKHAFN
jgi:hypothetical protein